MSTQQNGKPILVARYYILYLKDITNIRMIPYYFSSKALARYAIQHSIKTKNRKWFKVVSGKYIKKHNPPLYKSSRIYVVKYKYPKDLTTHRERSRYRLRIRRKLKRWGLLIQGKPVGYIKGQV